MTGKISAIISPLTAVVLDPIPANASLTGSIKRLHHLCKEFNGKDFDGHADLLKVADQLIRDCTAWLAKAPKNGTPAKSIKYIQTVLSAAKQIKIELAKSPPQDQQEARQEANTELAGEDLQQQFKTLQEHAATLLAKSTDFLNQKRARIAALKRKVDGLRETLKHEPRQSEVLAALAELLTACREVHDKLVKDYKAFYLSSHFEKTTSRMSSDTRFAEFSRGAMTELLKLQDKIAALQEEAKNWIIAAEKLERDVKATMPPKPAQRPANPGPK